MTDVPGPTEYRLTNADGQKLFCRRWTPEKPRGLVFLSHGFSEHIGYYEEIAQDLSAAGYVVAGHDHVGHGQSDGTRALVSAVSVYVRDMFLHTDLMKEEHPGLPIFLLSHSMGSTIALKGGFNKAQYFKGMILIAPCLIVDPDMATPMKKAMARVLGSVFPQFPVAPLDLNFVTRNAEKIEQFKKDPLRFHGYVKAGWATAMLKALEEIEKGMSSFNCPFLILHGSDDKICALQGSKLLHEKAHSSDKALKVYPDAYHNLLTEMPDVARAARKDCLHWIQERTA